MTFSESWSAVTWLARSSLFSVALSHSKLHDHPLNGDVMRQHIVVDGVKVVDGVEQRSQVEPNSIWQQPITRPLHTAPYDS